LVGVGGGEVFSIASEGVACLCSPIEEGSSLLSSRVKEGALAAYKVIQDVFAENDVITFRFPTLFVDEEAIRAHLREKGNDYREGLARIAGHVQMEVFLPIADEKADRSSGTSYLKSVQKRGKAAKSGLDELLARCRPEARDAKSRHEKGGFRVYALVPRGCDMVFRRKLESQGDGAFRVSGPWPPMAFLPESDPDTA